MTGVTVREWGAILMLRSLKSPESYFQAAFRVQSPWACRDADGDARRAQAQLLRLRVRPQPRAVAASPSTASASPPTATRRPSAGDRAALNYLPIFGFSGGAMPELDARRRARLGDRRHRRDRAGAAVELAAAGRRQRAHPRRRSSTTQSCWRRWSRSRTSARSSTTPSRSSRRPSC